MHRFALLGAGFIGSVHAANLASHPGVDFTLIYDIDSVRAERLADEHGAQATDDLEAAFDPDGVDAVFIASSTDAHADHLRRAADAGLAVLCESRLTLTSNVPPMLPVTRRATTSVPWSTSTGASTATTRN